MNASRPLLVSPLRLLVALATLIVAFTTGGGFAEAQNGVAAINLDPAPAVETDNRVGPGHVGSGGLLFDDVVSGCCVAPRTTPVGVQVTGRSPSSAVLGDNLVASGVSRPGNSAAHHIVAGGAERAAPARAVLDRFGIDINRAANGVFLPANRSVPNPSGAAVHSTLHTNQYYSQVNQLLGQATTRQEALDALDFIRGELLAGRSL